jgi:phage-related protein (TIGR01555 family)
MEDFLDSWDCYSSPMSGGDIGKILSYGQHRLDVAFKENKYVQKIVQLIPKAANQDLPIINAPNDLSSDIYDYLYNVPILNREVNDIYGAVELACCYARLYGDGFIILGLNNGNDIDKPLVPSRVKSLDWVAVKHRYNLGYQGNNYSITMDGTNKKQDVLSIHPSRVIRVVGQRLLGQALVNNHYYNDSVLTCCLDQIEKYHETINQVSLMLRSHSSFVLSMKNFGKSVAKNGIQSVYKRFQALMQGLTLGGGYIFDADNESASFLNRNYGGVDAILSKLEDYILSLTDLPRSKLFGASKATAMSSSANGDTNEWALIVEEYQLNTLLPVYSKLRDVVCNILAVDKHEVSIKFHPVFPDTEEDIVNKLSKLASIDQSYLNMGVITADEIRQTRYIENNTETLFKVENLLPTQETESNESPEQPIEDPMEEADASNP